MATLQELLNNKYLSNKNTNIIELENQGNPTGALDLKDFANVETLKLYGNSINSDNYFKTIQSIPNKEKITFLGFGYNGINDPRFDYIGANFPNLDSINLGWNPINNDISIKGLENCRVLRVMTLGEGEKKYKDMEYLPVSLTNYNGSDNSSFVFGLRRESIKREARDIARLQSNLNKSVEFAKKYEEQWKYYKETLRVNYLNDVPFWPDGLKEVKKVLDQLKTDKNQLEQDKQNLNTQITNLQQTINNNQGTSEQVTNLNQQLTSKDNEIKSKDSQITTLNTQITNKDKTIKNQEDFITQRDNTIKAQEGEITKKIDTISELNKENQSLKDQIQALKDQSDLQAVQEVGVSDK